MKSDVRVSNYCKFGSQLLTLFTSSLNIAGLLTAMLLSSWFTARCGRRPSMIIGGAAFLTGGGVNVYMAILGRALLGVGLGFVNQAVLLYLSEMAPARYRGAFSNGFQLRLCLGSLAANIINYGAEKITGGWGWRLGLRLILSRPRYRPQLAIAVLMPAFTQLNGINAIGFYAPVLLRTVGMGESLALLSTVVTVVIYMASTIVFMFVIDRFGHQVFPLEIRSAGQSTTVASGFVFTIFIAQGFPAMLCWMRAWLFFFFAGWIVVMTAFVYLFLPETKGMPIEQIGKVWRDHWFWGRVVGSDELQATHKVSHK
ncbi:hypothetical protein BDA96_05G186600 [Sorghum bicolor]|uniref:Major facilitator superfamily (MFS) profile domain-containing protein n=1 Tax=Sorghum bicolor TaxID=4558 RepID=A0A921UGY1_SORBI|nr:hypothetical protein BDA96_05G186600 [Sorghum bicolor]